MAVRVLPSTYHSLLNLRAPLNAASPLLVRSFRTSTESQSKSISYTYAPKTTVLKSLSSTYSLLKLLSPLKSFSVCSFGSSASSESDCDSNHSTNYSDSDSETSPRDDTMEKGQGCPLVNSFLKEGPMEPNKFVTTDAKAYYARLDMPGIGKEGLKVWVENNALQFKGVQEMAKRDGPSPLAEEGLRKYSGEIDLSKDRYNFEEIEAELKNGILTVVVPKLKPEIKKKVINVKLK